MNKIIKFILAITFGICSGLIWYWGYEYIVIGGISALICAEEIKNL